MILLKIIAVVAIGVILGVVTNEALGADPWSSQDIALEVTWEVIHALDWGTTLDIASHRGMYEMNPILGDHPDRGRINAYMALGAVLHPVVTHFLPSKWRPYFQGFTIGMSGFCVINNFHVGLGIRF